MKNDKGVNTLNDSRLLSTFNNVSLLEEFLKVGIEYFKANMPTNKIVSFVPTVEFTNGLSKLSLPNDSESKEAFTNAKPEESPTLAVDCYASDISLLEHKTRKELVLIAQPLGIDTVGKKAEDLRSLIKEYHKSNVANSFKTVENKSDQTQLKAKIVMNLIDENYDRYVGQIDKDSTEPGALKCGGDCLKCPHPEFPTTKEQVDACYKVLHEDLDIKPELGS